MSDSTFQSKVAKPRTSKGHKGLLDGGRKDLTKYGAPFSNARPVDTSNAFLAKEEHSADVEDIEEISAMGAGAVAGHVGSNKPVKKKKNKIKQEDVDMQSREEIVKEMRTRKVVSKMLDLQKRRYVKNSINDILENFRLRSVLSKLVLLESDVEKSPHRSTAVNVLDQVFGKIKKNIEDGYKMLTTDKDQRDSYRRHLLNAVDNALKAEETNISAASSENPTDLAEKSLGSSPGKGIDNFVEKGLFPVVKGITKIAARTAGAGVGGTLGALKGLGKGAKSGYDLVKKLGLEEGEGAEELEEVEINIKSDSDPLDIPDEDKVLPNVGDKGGDTEEPTEDKSEEEEFGIEGEELTGRDRAFPVFKQISEPIITGYKGLHNPNDREVYHDYLLTNMKMLMDQFEDELSGIVDEPESDSYKPGSEDASAPVDDLAGVEDPAA